MSDKPFKTYQELISKLRDEKKLTISAEDEPHAIALLKKFSYFSLVSGYKMLFKAPDGTYLSGTTIDDIFALYQFDDTLRDIFFHAIQIVEKHTKSLLSYSFVKEYGEAQSEYMNPAHFDVMSGAKCTDRRQKEIKKLISTFVSVATPPSEHNYITHQWSTHQNVPLWCAIKAITFGNTSKMYSLCYPKVQSDVAKEFPGVSADALTGMLDMLTRVRNVCAHNERLYDFSVRKNRAIQDMPSHAQLGIAKSSAGLYNQGKTDLFAALICLKYLLDDTDFQATILKIDAALSTLFQNTKMIPPNKILSCMGFPQNWKNL